jgi:beta-glucosidase
VVALTNGAVVTTAAWRADAGAIVEFWLPGQAYGDSITDVLLGDVNPCGRLSETVPIRLEDTSGFLDFPGELGHVRYSEGIHVGYRWYDARRLAVDYPFGHGLSYTTFGYSDLDIAVHDAGDAIAFTISLTLTNEGSRAGAEVVQVYVGDRSGVLQMPERELRAFAKVELSAGATKRVQLQVPRADLEHFHPDAGWVFAAGRMQVAVGASSRDLRLSADVELPGQIISAPLTVWSTLGEWFANPLAGPALQDLIEQRGGIRGRLADLLSDPIGRDSVLANPLAAVSQFPGFPLSDEDAEAVLRRTAPS